METSLTTHSGEIREKDAAGEIQGLGFGYVLLTLKPLDSDLMVVGAHWHVVKKGLCMTRLNCRHLTLQAVGGAVLEGGYLSRLLQK